MSRILLSLIIIGILCNIAAGSTVGFTFSIDDPTGNYDSPFIKIVNDSYSAEITSMHFTIGDAGYNFDEAGSYTSSASDLSVETLYPDDVSGGVRSDMIGFNFTGFALEDYFQFNVDVDPDSYNSTVDARNVFFNNSGMPNSLLYIRFSNDIIVSATLPDFTTDDYSISESYQLFDNPDEPDDDIEIPEPFTITLVSLGGIILRKRRK